MSLQLDLRPDLSRVQAPVLLVHDLENPLVPLEGIRWLANKLPSASLKILRTRAVTDESLPRRGDARRGRPMSTVLGVVCQAAAVWAGPFLC
jgi:hypothetical protein